MKECKTKLLFVVYGLGIGGIEKCLVNLVNNLDLGQYDVTIAVMNPEYAFLDKIRKEIKVIPFEGNFVNTTDTVAAAKSLGLLRRIPYLLRYVVFRIAVKLNLESWRVQKRLPECYDIAIAYSHTGNVPQYVISNVNAKKKVLWYHTLWGQDRNYPCYSRFDRVVAVSSFCRKNFEKTYPTLSDRTVVLHNLYDYSSIKQLAEEKQKVFQGGKLHLVTVGRLSPEKGIELAIRSCAQLKKLTDIPFDWHWVGDGPARNLAQKLINELNLEDCFVLRGNQANPYPYMAQCDIYVQPSQSEAFCTTVIEAKTLKKAIITSDVGSFREQICHMEDGIISKQDPSEMASAILQLMKDCVLRESLAERGQGNIPENEHTLLQYGKFLDELQSP